MPALLSPAVLLLFGLLTGLSSSLDPRDPNVCSLWESFTTSVKESYSHPYDHVTEEPCSDPPARFSASRITYRTAYRQAVKTDHRKRYQCCPGYYESGGKCVPHCSKECVHGRCVAPDRCQCEGGWRGEDCSSACDDQHWGPVCHQQCKCKNGALCDPVEGACRCPPGFIGRYCEDPCPAGTFGKGCLQRCGCKNGASCDKATGECSCRDGFTVCCGLQTCGPKYHYYCLVQGCRTPKGDLTMFSAPQGLVCTEPCPEGRFGADCARECLCHNRGKCDPETGHCKCAKGFTGDRCDEECAAGTYGQDCKGVCDCANGARCFNIHGGCLCEPGFSGPQCKSRMCKPGNYGVHCEHRCFCEEKHTLSCHPMKGECTCQPGWAGLHCNETCPHGFYGDGCLEPCLCVNGGECDGATGRCHCPPGFTGLHCENICKSGTYGRNCSLECSCENFIDCSPVDGTCFCKEGWRGPDCSAPCSEGTWGPGCNSTCQCSNGAKCSPADGSCICAAGWQGAHCDQPCPMGAFGPGCLKRCDCVQASGCQPADGECHCLPGWRGERRPAWLCFHRSGPEGGRAAGCNHLAVFVQTAKYASDTTTGNDLQLEKTVHTSKNPLSLDGRRTLSSLSGPRCSEPCPEGLWGPNCNLSCFKHCPNSDTCARETGECVCRPGYWGVSCQNSEQRSEPDVLLSLSAAGHMVASRIVQVGSVMVPLPPGEGDSWGAIGGIVVLVLLVVLLLVLLLMYRRRQKDKQSNTPTVSFSTSRTVNSEYAVPEVPHSYHHYYSNPSYHTLSQNRPPLPHLPNNHDRIIKVRPLPLRHPLALRRRSLSSSLNSENPYATIKDLPGLPPCPPESSYMEMKSAVPRERAYTEISPPPFRTATLRRGQRSTIECPFIQKRQSSLGHAPHEDPHCHYDLPVNSHIPGHYDLPPLRRPPSPSPRRTFQ
uniref:Platelet endothelial aggregation receptor 1 n=1 Tax=Oryzias melastigma TaxID=30732 RepID=A0A3B3DVC1_ORYME